MKKILKVGIVLVICIIIIILAVLLINRNKVAGEDENLAFMDEPGYFILGQKPERTTSSNTYFSVEACVEKAISYASEDNKSAVYNLLNVDYIKSKNITQDNVINLTELKNIEKYKTQEVYELVGSNYASYYLKAIIQNNQNMYFNVNWDIANAAFDLRILTKAEYEKYLETTIEEVEPEEATVEKNKNNSIPYKYLIEEDIIEKYFIDYINSAIDFPEEAYNHLDEKYRKAKFGSLENFKQYVQNNTQIKEMYVAENTNMEDFSSYMEYRLSVKDVGMEKFSAEKKDDYTQYICIDSYNNYYIFRVISLMQYTLILDTYTIDIPEFTTKYEESNNQEKVILNINKFMLALNDKDYKYIYSILADSFKTKYFSNYETFEKYMELIFFEENKFDYMEFGDEAGTYYTYKVKITDAEEKSDKSIEKTFIMLLGEGTDFELSFNIE